MTQQPGVFHWRNLRNRMVEDQLIARGIRDPRVIRAMRAIKRHEFVPADMLYEAYNDSPLPIGLGQYHNRTL